jgi:hypothetical protein
VDEVALVIRVEDRPGRRYLDVSLDSNDEYHILFDTIIVTARTGDDRAYSVGHFLLDGYA